MSVELIELAKVEDINLLKVKSHATTRLQPECEWIWAFLKTLDRTIKNPLWPQKTFVHLLSKVWQKGLLKKTWFQAFALLVLYWSNDSVYTIFLFSEPEESEDMDVAEIEEITKSLKSTF